jgi:DNA-binding NarL/FixJ family response regulator
VVVEEHEPTRLGFALVLSRQAWVERCFTASNRQEAMELVRRHRPAVVLLEVTAFVAPTVDALQAAHPSARIVLSSHCGASAAMAARQLGVAGVVEDDVTHQELVTTLHAVAFNREFIPRPGIAEHELGLSDRERQVLALLATGVTNAQISAELHLGLDSIKKYATRIYRKVGVKNRTELARRIAEYAHATATPSSAGHSAQ